MNSKHRIIAVVLAFLVVVAFATITFLDPGKRALSDLQDSATGQQHTSQNAVNTSPQSSQTGRYINPAPDTIAQTTGTKILFFHAEWSPQCRELDTEIKSNGVPNGVTVIKVDYDTDQELRQKYGVTSHATFVRIDDAGNSVKEFDASSTPKLDAVLKNLL